MNASGSLMLITRRKLCLSQTPTSSATQSYIVNSETPCRAGLLPAFCSMVWYMA